MGIKYKSSPKGLGEFIIRAKSACKAEAARMFLKADLLRNSACFKESIKYYLSSLMIDRYNYKTYLGLGIAYKTQGDMKRQLMRLKKQKECHILPRISTLSSEYAICIPTVPARQ